MPCAMAERRCNNEPKHGAKTLPRNSHKQGAKVGQATRSVAATTETGATSSDFPGCHDIFTLGGHADTCQECSGKRTQGKLVWRTVSQFQFPSTIQQTLLARFPAQMWGRCQDLGTSTRTECFLTGCTPATAPKPAVGQPEKTRGRATGENSRPPVAGTLASCSVPRHELYSLYLPPPSPRHGLH